ncbi:T9SS type A sorting domain-containing protein [Rufibacter roseus]|uniref:T9SS type A sorting domain-containing protein n=1 Tax=Rufibacter roseus TaxID=1567108 RepID=A0ABW2DQP7_9BACT|nr:T9SS type A sorting domain-containing protein [Rufibacter roseus]
MKRSHPFLFMLAIIFVFSSCDGQLTSIDRVSFDNFFPKPNKDLSKIIGNTLLLKSGSDTIYLSISSDKDINLITETLSGDTVFYGKVNKFRGLYYFSQAVNDTSYLIHAVKISDNLIYGLTSVFQQTALIDDEIRKGKFPKLVKYIPTDSSIFMLRTDKREMRKLYSSIIGTIKPDTVLQDQQKGGVELDAVAAKEQIMDAEESELFFKVYPNPVSDFVNVMLQEQNINYQLIDLNGKTMATGILSKQTNRISTATLTNGIYILNLTGAGGKTKESVRIVKN